MLPDLRRIQRRSDHQPQRMNWEQKLAINPLQKAQRDRDLKDLVGEVIAGKYKVIDILGRGGSGVVFHVEQTFLGTHLALKLPTFSTYDTEIESLRFQREAKATAKLHHSNLIKIFDFGMLPNKQPYLVMELVNGLSLAEYIKTNGPLSVDEATSVFSQAASGLKFAHDHGVIHRDVKPGNIMLVSGMPLGAPGFVKILDFGIAKDGTEDGRALTQTGDVFGSPYYMSPEQCNGEKVDQRADIYSLGCSFYEALIGTPPFVSSTNACATTQPPSSKTMMFALGLGLPVLIGIIVLAAFQIQQGNASKTDPTQTTQKLSTTNSPLSFGNELDNVSVDQADRDEIARKFFETSPPIVSKIVSMNGQSKKVFMFPETAIGVVSQIGKKFDGSDFSEEAMGDVYVPPNVELNLDVGGRHAEAFKYPAIFKKIGATEFASLSMSPPIALRIISREEKLVEFCEILDIASHWKNLRNLNLQTFQLNKEALDSIDAMKALTSIALFNERGFEADVSKRKFIQRMEGILLVDCSITDFMAPLSESKKLKSFSFKFNCAIDDKNFALLQHCPHLDTMHITSNALSDSMAVTISKCIRLKGIVIENGRVTAKQLKQITACSIT